VRRCKICGEAVADFARAEVLGRHSVAYFRCIGCGFVQTEEPYWLEEAYSTAIARADVGAVARNLRLTDVTQALIQWVLPPSRRYLDFGGGYGLFVRLMRDRGFDFRWLDKHAQPLYCLGFEAEESDEGFDLVTAFEVVEHAVEPLALLAELLRKGHHVLFSTELLPQSAPRPGEWWYYVPSQGQHVSIFSRASVARAAENLGVRLTSEGSLHLLHREPLGAWRLRLATREGLAALLCRLHRRRSLIGADFETLTGSKLE